MNFITKSSEVLDKAKCISYTLWQEPPALDSAQRLTTVKDDNSSTFTQFDQRFWSEYRESLIAEVRALQRRIKAIEHGMRNSPTIDTKKEKQ